MEQRTIVNQKSQFKRNDSERTQSNGSRKTLNQRALMENHQSAFGKRRKVRKFNSNLADIRKRITNKTVRDNTNKQMVRMFSPNARKINLNARLQARAKSRFASPPVISPFSKRGTKIINPKSGFRPSTKININKTRFLNIKSKRNVAMP